MGYRDEMDRIVQQYRLSAVPQIDLQGAYNAGMDPYARNPITPFHMLASPAEQPSMWGAFGNSLGSVLGSIGDERKKQRKAKNLDSLTDSPPTPYGDGGGGIGGNYA